MPGLFALVNDYFAYDEFFQCISSNTDDTFVPAQSQATDNAITARCPLSSIFADTRLGHAITRKTRSSSKGMFIC
ncbi:hypothetical protein PM082_014519 [Marasmius tenuissimus]|nr:hypothetical protein PM082_014519 [Marasmius tenuissimus]